MNPFKCDCTIGDLWLDYMGIIPFFERRDIIGFHKTATGKNSKYAKFLEVGDLKLVCVKDQAIVKWDDVDLQHCIPTTTTPTTTTSTTTTPTTTAPTTTTPTATTPTTTTPTTTTPTTTTLTTTAPTTTTPTTTTPTITPEGEVISDIGVAKSDEKINKNRYLDCDFVDSSEFFSGHGDKGIIHFVIYKKVFITLK